MVLIPYDVTDVSVWDEMAQQDGPPEALPSEVTLRQRTRDLLRRPNGLEALRRRYGLTSATLTEFEIGLEFRRAGDEPWISIPIRDQYRTLVNVRRRYFGSEPALHGPEVPQLDRARGAASLSRTPAATGRVTAPSLLRRVRRACGAESWDRRGELDRRRQRLAGRLGRPSAPIRRDRDVRPRRGAIRRARRCAARRSCTAPSGDTADRLGSRLALRRARPERPTSSAQT